MRKSNPDYLRTQFHAELNGLLAHFSRVAAAIAGSQHEMADVSRLAENVFVSAYVAFEGFVSNLFLAYLNRDPTVFQEFHDNSIRQSVGTKFGQWHVDRLTFASLQHVNLDTIRQILDPEQRNLTFTTTAAIKLKAGQILRADYAQRFNAINDHDERLIDTAKAIRDYISHRSDSAYQLMNGRLASVDKGAPNGELGRGANSIQAVGSFLKSETAASRRIVLYIERLIQISTTMSQ